MAKFEVTCHETWNKQFTRTIEAESEAEAVRIAETEEKYIYPFEESSGWELDVDNSSRYAE